ncbi:hypothetical protein N8797_01080 [Pontimonas sp.]|nr:hypothetical protein [Pontimonas sp.]
MILTQTREALLERYYKPQKYPRSAGPLIESTKRGQRIFILGVGAQKSATTWFYRQIAQNSNFVSKDQRKELHYWDEKYALRTPRSNVQRFMRGEESVQPALTNDDLWFASIKPSTGFFRSKEIRADVTPAYAGLPPSAFREIKEGLDYHSIPYRIVYFMRDPVARILSAYHMYYRGGADFSHVLPELRDFGNLPNGVRDKNIVRFAHGWNAGIRTRYDLTLQNLRSVFPQRHVHVALTENLQSKAALSGLAHFCEVPPRTFRSIPVHEGIYQRQLSEKTTLAIAKNFAPTYNAVAKIFPEIYDLWPSYRILLSVMGKSD